MVVMVVHKGDILAHAKDQATMERFAAGLGVKFKVKSMVETFSLEKASRTSVHSGVPTQPQTSEEEEDIFYFPYREAVRALMRTARMTRPDMRARYELWPGSTLDWRIKRRC